MTAGPCRSCGAQLEHTFCDLGMSPLSNAFLSAEQLERMEPFYPLHAYVCARCFLVQLQEFESPEHIFAEGYAYFSSYSQTWLDHARRYVDTMIERFAFGPASLVVEIASNDGYLLQYFKEQNVPVLGIEPAENCARAAVQAGIPTLVKFFGSELASEIKAQHKSADLLLGNNVLAHVPSLNDFVKGLKILLKARGVVTMEFPHLLNLMRENQFDTIYHEHFSYFSFLAVEGVFARHGLSIFDVDELPTHGGSLRIYASHTERADLGLSPRVTELREREISHGLRSLATYRAFGKRVEEVKRALLEFLIRAKGEGKRICGYGAPAKGNTLLNYCGVRNDFLDFTVDRSPHKQGLFLPGTHIPVFAPEKLSETKPDYVLILPWNLKEEIMAQLSFIRDWGGRFVIPIPRVEVVA
ncbi:MAG TPA: class I SAM-dependent methyltransferase [Burkholderiales bacterium]|nr:class I SAM-dependent methyltransferase [Burkholderiales bacterium]